jgi:hypothetical protein
VAVGVGVGATAGQPAGQSGGVADAVAEGDADADAVGPAVVVAVLPAWLDRQDRMLRRARRHSGNHPDASRRDSRSGEGDLQPGLDMGHRHPFRQVFLTFQLVP